MIVIKGTYRVLSIYNAEKAAYVVLKDKEDGSQVKIGFDLPLPAGFVDDALVSVDGKLAPRIFSNNVSLTYSGAVKAVSEGK